MSVSLHCLQRRKCKKVIAQNGDFGIDQYVSWNLSNEELTLEVIWEQFEEFCEPQSNEVRARFDLLTSFKQGEKVWMNGTSQHKHKLL